MEKIKYYSKKLCGPSFAYPLFPFPSLSSWDKSKTPNLSDVRNFSSAVALSDESPHVFGTHEDEGMLRIPSFSFADIRRDG